MDFYTYKLIDLKASPSDYTLQERAYKMYNSVVAEKEQRIEDLKESYKNSLSYGALTNRSVGTHSHLNVTSAMYGDLLAMEREELAAITHITPTQYIFSLVQNEGERIEAYIEGKIEDFASTKDKYSKYYNNEGLMPKISGLFGKREEKTQELGQEVSTLVEEIAVGQDSLATWESLSVEDKLEYIVGRYETQGLTSFDTNGIEKFTRSMIEINKFDNQYSSQTLPPVEQ